jgi:hypothetical protein
LGWYPDVASAAKRVRRRDEQDSGSLSRPEKALYHDLDFLCGTWTKNEADEFDASLAHQRMIDPELGRDPGDAGA